MFHYQIKRRPGSYTITLSVCVCGPMSYQVLVSLQVTKLPITRPMVKTTSPKLTVLIDETLRTGAAASSEKLLICGETVYDAKGVTTRGKSCAQ